MNWYRFGMGDIWDIGIGSVWGIWGISVSVYRFHTDFLKVIYVNNYLVSVSYGYIGIRVRPKLG